jgi:hypothetical protein
MERRIDYLCTNCCQYVEGIGEEGECVVCGEMAVVIMDERQVELLEEDRQDRGDVVFAMDIADTWKGRYDSDIHFPNE